MFDYNVDANGSGDFCAISEVIGFIDRSWWRRWLHRFFKANLHVSAGVYDGITYSSRTYHLKGS